MKLPTPGEQWEEFASQSPKASTEETECFMKMYYFAGMVAAIEFVQAASSLDPKVIDRDKVFTKWKEGVGMESLAVTERLAILGRDKQGDSD